MHRLFFWTSVINTAVTLLSFGSRASATAAENEMSAPVSGEGTEGGSEELAIPLGPVLGPLAFQRGVALPPVAPEVLETWKHQGITAGSKRFQIGVGRALEKPMAVDQRTAPEAEWSTLPNGWRIWPVKVSSAGALGLRVHLQFKALPTGARVVVYDPANPTPDETPITWKSLGPEMEVWTKTVFSDQVIVECQLPPQVRGTTVAYTISGVSHIYTLPRLTKQLSVSPGIAGTCNVDATCHPEWAQEASGVGQMFFVDGGGTYACTGCLLAGNGPDYFLTANHCVPNQSVASSIEFFWFYQTSTCNGPTPDISTVPTTTGGAQLLATSPVNDFTFLRLRAAPPGGTYRLPWSVNPPSPGETLTCIHHPSADYLRISFGHEVGSDGNFWGVQWFSGVTEDGSSGSPLLNANHQVIGQLNGGFNGGGSSCADPSAPDQYGRFDVTYQSIQKYLTGTSGGGNNTGGGVPSVAFTKGTFYGLFSDPNGVAQGSSGYVTLSTTTKGRFSGSLLQGARRYSLSGQFDDNGNAEVTTGSRNFSLAVQLRLDLTGDPDQITGTVGDSAGTWTANLSGDRDVFDGKSNVEPDAGQYTMVIPGGNDPTMGPSGASYGTVTVDKTGRVRLTGVLADGTRVSQTSGVSKNGQWPLYIPLYSGQGSVFSSITVAQGTDNDLSGGVTWTKPSLTKAKAYPGGFILNSSALGSAFSRYAFGSTVLDLGSGQVSFSGGNLASDFANQITLGSNNRVANLSSNKLSLSFSPSTGTFTGRVTDPSTSKPVSFGGVILQNQNAGYGFFLGGGQSGLVTVGQ